MRRKHILIFGKEEILMSGLLRRLQDQETLSVDHFTTKNVKKMVAEIKSKMPDVILVDDSLTSLIYEIFYQLPKNHFYHLIVVNSKENKIQIFITQNIEIETITDFIEVL